jgi:hypothetical protein
MDIDSETIHSPPSIVHRETNIIPVDLVALVNPVVPVDLVSLIDIPGDVTVGHKRPD